MYGFTYYSRYKCITHQELADAVWNDVMAAISNAWRHITYPSINSAKFDSDPDRIRYNWVFGCFKGSPQQQKQQQQQPLLGYYYYSKNKMISNMRSVSGLKINSLRLRRLCSVVDSGESECRVSALPRASLWHHLCTQKNLGPWHTGDKRSTLSRNFFTQLSMFHRQVIATPNNDDF